MKTNNNTTNNGYNFIINKNSDKTAKQIILEANNGRNENPNCHEWYGKMVHDAGLAASKENKTLISETIESLFTSVIRKDNERDTSLFFANYMDDPYAVQLSIRPDRDKPGFYMVMESERRIDFLTIDKAWCEHINNEAETLATDGRYANMTSIFMDNCIRNIAGDLSENTNKVMIPARSSLNDERKEYDFTNNSITALEKQLNVIVAAIMGENAPKMLKADVKYILNAITKATNNNRDAETKGHLITVRDKAFMNNLFRAIEVRRNNASYTIDSKANIHKAKKEKKVLTEKAA